MLNSKYLIKDIAIFDYHTEYRYNEICTVIRKFDVEEKHN